MLERKNMYSDTMSALKNSIDYEDLEEELHAALAADELYKLRNDAKIRAVEQGVPTYEHFRQMVNGAHLKPLERDDIKPKVGVQWNPTTNSTKSHLSTVPITSGKSNCDTNKNENFRGKSPESCEEFLQFWRTITDCTERFIYVWNLRNILQTRIFRIEIPASFFSDFTDTCLQYLPNVDDVTPITELFSILSTCNRFGLTICFMTKDEQFTCERLFQQLHVKGRSQDESLEGAIVLLAAKYRIKLD